MIRTHISAAACAVLLAAVALMTAAMPPVFCASAPRPVTADQGKAGAAAEPGATITYQLPTTGPLPQTYRVTLAIVDAKDPNWIISQFASGVVREVTAENQGKFTEVWNGLDDNYMPVPPGNYGVKGIFMSAKKWGVDGQFHSITPRYLTAANAYQPPLAPEGEVPKSEPFSGDPVGAPMGDISIGSNGIAVFYYQYLENGKNNPRVDLKKEIGYDQFVDAYNSGGAGGGQATTTDGDSVWSYGDEGGAKFVYRADQKPFGSDSGAHRSKVLVPEGRVTSLENWRNPVTKKTNVFIAQRGKMEAIKGRRHTGWYESKTEWINKITVHDGDTAAQLAEIPMFKPQSLVVRGDNLYILHPKEGATPAAPAPAAAVPAKAGEGEGEEAEEPKTAPVGPALVVTVVKLKDGLPDVASVRDVFTVPSTIKPTDIAVDSKGLFYLCDYEKNHVYQLNAKGEITKTYGKLDAQVPGKYDKNTFINPFKLAMWTDPAGKERLMVMEHGGPNRVSEWYLDGTLIRDFLTLQTKANDGYTCDPDHPEMIYLPGQNGWLTRWKLNYEKREWTVDAVWPYAQMQRVESRSKGMQIPKFIRVNGREYIACGKSFVVYRHNTDNGKDEWVLSAGITRELAKEKGKPMVVSFWHDGNANGKVDDDELTPASAPKGVMRYHGDEWLDDLSLVSIGMGSKDVWRVAAREFDTHGNPVFKEWQKLITDPIFEARANGTADAIRGGNELTDNYNSDWGQACGDVDTAIYVNARGGPNFSANYGSQHKITKYVPDGKGGMKMVWRTGRQTLGGTAQPGQIQGAIHNHKPLNGIFSLIDQSRSGVLLYTDEGLYVDTLFPDNRNYGVYSLPGEFFAGAIFPNKTNSQIYIAMGKYTPLLFGVDGWSLKESPVKKLETVQKTVSISAGQIATPSELVLSLRGGAGTARFANFAPAIGGVDLDGGMEGWEATDPVEFSAGPDQKVQVRCAYDGDHIYLRWQVRLGNVFEAKPLFPVERIFTHDRLADTLSFYIQGDPNAKPGTSRDGRPGDVRFVFGLFNKEEKSKDKDKGAAASTTPKPAETAAPAATDTAADPRSKARVKGKEEPEVKIDTTNLVPVVVGMYPKWPLTVPVAKDQKASPQTYSTAAGGTVKFDNVAQIPGAKLGYRFDRDGKGFVLVAAIPRAAVPNLTALDSGVRTMMNFEATFSGHTKFWWSNADSSASRETYDEPTEARLYPGSWAQGRFLSLDKGVTLNNWQIIGPFGGPGTEGYSYDLRGNDKNSAIKLLSARMFPVDEQGVDLNAVYTGEMIKGWWPKVNEVRWKPASVADMDTRVAYGTGAAQVYFGATWVYAPEEMELDFHLQSHAQTTSQFMLNGEVVQKGDIKDDRQGASRLKEVVKKLRLNAGWNQITARGFCVGYAPFRLGVVLDGPMEKLWKLKRSNHPPAPLKP
ncbi:MAG: hypothetical protein ACAI35_10815 [Candidatus Methylacidiphilales bacterium]